MNLDLLSNEQKIKEFDNFLKSHIHTKKDGQHTHTSNVNNKYYAVYQILDKDQDYLINMYKRVMSIHKNLHLLETQKKVGPYLIDIDINTSEQYDERQYSDENIKKLVNITTKIIKEYLQIKKNTIEVFVYEKKEPTYEESKKRYKDGFHIVYPLAINVDMRLFIFKKMKEQAIKEKIFDNIICDNVDDVYDKSVTSSNSWYMVESCKPSGNKYELTTIYDENLNEVRKDKYSNEELVVLLSLKRFTQEDELKLKPKYQNIIEDQIEKTNNDVITKKHNEKLENSLIKNDCHKMVLSTNKDVNDAKKLVRLLSRARATKYEDWTLVGWALYNISETLFEDFMWFSQQTLTNNYDKNSCIKFWQSAEKRMLGIKALNMWAKQDNPEGYMKYLKENISQVIRTAESGTHNDIAIVAYEMYKHEFVCTSIEKNDWYEFQKHKWVKVEKGYTLKNRISDELSKEFTHLSSFYNEKSSNLDKNDRDWFLKKSKHVLGITEKLGNEQFLNYVIGACARRFINDKFLELLDENKFIFGCENGVLDLLTYKFRNGTPDDYISITCGYDYKVFKYEDRIVQELMDFLKTLQQEPDMLEHVCRYISSFLDGYTKIEQFVIWTGSGANGKSSLISLIRKTFGKYFGTMSVAILTKKRSDSGSAAPELVNKKGKRVVVLQEPESDESIKVGKMKELTGDDTIEARSLYSLPIEFNPQFKFMLICNKCPPIPANDNGTWRRLKCVPFETIFVDGEPKNIKEITKNDNIKKRIPLFPQAFLWLLFNHYYKSYVVDGLAPPKKVTEFTDKYRKANDQILEFLNDQYDMTQSDKDKVSITSFYEEFLLWCRTNNAYSKPKKTEVVDYISNIASIKVVSANIHRLKPKVILSELEIIE